MFEWRPDVIRFMRDAAEQVGFYDELARLALNRLPGCNNIIDAGCGLGYLSLALAKRVGQVTAADVAAPALNVLRENIIAGGIDNIRVMEGDVFALCGETRFDGAVLCFFGGTEETLRFIKHNCKKAVLLKKNWETHRFTTEKRPLGKYSYMQACKELDALKVPYTTQSAPVEMGQPFRSEEDAVLFFELYRQPDTPEVERAAVLAQLVKTDSPQFPYYMPAKRPVGMIMLDAGDIPDSI